MDSKARRRQSKVQQLNQMSQTSSAAARRLSGGSPVESAPPDPISAESPMLTPNLTPTSRTPSMTSIQTLAAAPRARATTLDVPGLTRSKVSPDGRIAKRDVGAKLVVVMVGLPARGKSYVTKKLCRYLNWQQHDCRIFNVGNTRRRANQNVGPSSQPLPDKTPPRSDTPTASDPQTDANTDRDATPDANKSHKRHESETSHAADFFSPDNKDTLAQREQWAYETLNELLDYILDGEGSVGILDATNTTIARRKMVLNRIRERSGGQLKVLFLESICTRSDIIEANVRLKLSGPDYKDMDQQQAITDFLQRLRNYELAYQTIGAEEENDPDFQYIKMINVGQKIECGNIKGFLAGQTAYFLLNFNLDERQIYITRHGESTDNEHGRIGGDAGLTERGKRYAKALAKFIEYKKNEFRNRQLASFAEHIRILEQGGSQPPTPLNEPQEINFCVWTSMLRRAVDTAAFFDENQFDLKEMRMLNEIDAGICDGMTYQEIKDKFPEEYKTRMADKILYRYPGVGGESYLDVINRLRAVIVEIERMQDNCLVVCHRVVARVLLAYFMNLGRDAIGDLEVPLHTLYVLEPKPYGVDWALYKYNERANWFYKVPKEAVTVKKQLRDKQRRYTVLPTLDMQLGDTRMYPTEEFHEEAIETDEDDEEGEIKDLTAAVARAL